MLIPSWIDDNSEIPDPFGYGKRAVEWLRKLKHPKSATAGRPFELDIWQERIIRKMYGPRHLEDVYDDGIRIARAGQRIVRRVVLVLPRGNRKTSLAAGINLLHLIGPERQPGNTIVSAASAHEQAMELFQEAALIIDHDPRLSKHVRILRGSNNTMTFAKENCRYKAIASDGKVQHGKTPNVIIADELHAWEGRAGRSQWEALDSALVKVPGTLMVIATTSGRGQDNLAWEQVERAIRIQKGEIEDPATLPVVFMAEEGDDWQDEKLWRAVNPGMKHGYPDLGSYRDKAKKALDTPSERDSFLQYNLNRWLDHSTSPYLPADVWDRGDKPLPEDIAGLPCWIGVDMSATTDLTAVVACVRKGDDFLLLPHFFCPADNLRARADRDSVPYPMWSEQGFLCATPGNVIDYRAVEACIRGLCERFDVREINFDRAYAAPVMLPLTDDGFPTATMQQGWVTQSPALNELERVAVSGKLIHGGHPVLRWCFMNVAIHTDSAGNRTMHKGKSTDRIDGAVASWMAVSRAAAQEMRSMYDREDWTDEMGYV